MPVFYSGFTLLGFLNSMIFLDQVGASDSLCSGAAKTKPCLDQVGAYSWTILFLITVGVAVLLSGVVSSAPVARLERLPLTEPSVQVLLSLKKDASHDQPASPRRSDDLEAATPDATPTSSMPLRRGSRARGEDSALFDAEEEEEPETSVSKFGEPVGSAQWEVGSDSDEENGPDLTKRPLEVNASTDEGFGPWADQPGNRGLSS